MDPMVIIIAIALAAFVIFQFRSSRKRQRETAKRQAEIVPGVEVMTNYGLYGVLLSIDEDTNVALIETTPGTVLKIHRQTILKAVEPEEPVADDAADDSRAPEAEPEFGERIETEATKPAAGTATEAGE